MGKKQKSVQWRKTEKVILHYFFTEPPFFVRPPSNVSAAAGSDAFLPCVAGGQPHPDTRWTFAGEPVDPERATVRSGEGILLRKVSIKLKFIQSLMWYVITQFLIGSCGGQRRVRVRRHLRGGHRLRKGQPVRHATSSHHGRAKVSRSTHTCISLHPLPVYCTYRYIFSIYDYTCTLCIVLYHKSQNMGGSFFIGQGVPTYCSVWCHIKYSTYKWRGFPRDPSWCCWIFFLKNTEKVFPMPQPNTRDAPQASHASDMPPPHSPFSAACFK